MDVSEMSPEEVEENNHIVSYIEKEAQWTFPEGISFAAYCLTFS